jgi:hypothetical protein
LRAVENRVLWRILGCEVVEVKGGWRGLYNEVHRGSYTPPNVVRMIRSRSVRWVGHAACMGKMTDAYKMLAGEFEGRTPVGVLKRKLEDNIKMDLKEIAFGGVDWVDLAEAGEGWRAVVNAITKFWVP